MKMIIRIEKLWPNLRYRVETAGVGMPQTFEHATEAWLHAEKLAAIYRRAGDHVQFAETGF